MDSWCSEVCQGVADIGLALVVILAVTYGIAAIVAIPVTIMAHRKERRMRQRMEELRAEHYASKGA